MFSLLVFIGSFTYFKTPLSRFADATWET